MAKARTEASSARAPGFIELNAVYTMAEFQARTGLGKSAMRAARRKGMRVLYAGRNAFVLGSDFVEFLTHSDAREG